MGVVLSGHWIIRECSIFGAVFVGYWSSFAFPGWSSSVIDSPRMVDERYSRHWFVQEEPGINHIIRYRIESEGTVDGIQVLFTSGKAEELKWQREPTLY